MRLDDVWIPVHLQIIRFRHELSAGSSNHSFTPLIQFWHLEMSCSSQFLPDNSRPPTAKRRPHPAPRPMGVGTVARCKVIELKKLSSDVSEGRGTMDWKSVFSAWPGGNTIGYLLDVYWLPRIQSIEVDSGRNKLKLVEHAPLRLRTL